MELKISFNVIRDFMRFSLNQLLGEENLMLPEERQIISYNAAHWVADVSVGIMGTIVR